MHMYVDMLAVYVRFYTTVVLIVLIVVFVDTIFMGLFLRAGKEFPQPLSIVYLYERSVTTYTWYT